MLLLMVQHTHGVSNVATHGPAHTGSVMLLLRLQHTGSVMLLLMVQHTHGVSNVATHGPAHTRGQ